MDNLVLISLSALAIVFSMVAVILLLYIIASEFSKLVKNQNNFRFELLESLERLERLKETELLDNHNSKQWEKVARRERMESEINFLDCVIADLERAGVSDYKSKEFFDYCVRNDFIPSALRKQIEEYKAQHPADEGKTS